MSQSGSSEILKAIAARLMLALVRFKQNKPEDAREILSKVLSLLPAPEPRHLTAARSKINSE